MYQAKKTWFNGTLSTGADEKASDLSLICRSSRQQSHCALQTSHETAYRWLKSHNLTPAQSENQQKGFVEYWSDLQRGVPRGNLGGQAGLLILEKLLIYSLLPLRTLITPIVVLVPLRPEWMSPLRSSFLLPWMKTFPQRVRRQPVGGLQAACGSFLTTSQAVVFVMILMVKLFENLS